MGQTLFEAHATMTNKKDKSLAVQSSHSGREHRQQYFPKDPSGISLSAQMSVSPTPSSAYNSTERRERALNFMHNFSILENGSLDFQGL